MIRDTNYLRVLYGEKKKRLSYLRSGTIGSRLGRKVVCPAGHIYLITLGPSIPRPLAHLVKSRLLTVTSAIPLRILYSFFSDLTLV